MILSYLKYNNIKNQWPAVLLLILPGMAISATPTPEHSLEDERWFEVELIIFAHNNEEALESEDWPTITDLVLPDGLVELTLPVPDSAEKSAKPVTRAKGDRPPTSPDDMTTDPVPMPIAYEMLPEEDLQLTDEYRKLKRSPRFEPLLHVAWRQPTFERENAQTVILYEGLTEAASEATTQNNAAGFEEEDNSMGPPNPRFIGTISLSVERYLHLAADLIYRTPVVERVAIPLSDLELWHDKPYPTLSELQGPAYQLEQWNVIHGFRLEESRRMRSRKVHYLDHPFFGVVVLVTPVELPKPNEEENALDPLRNISSPDG